MPYVIRKKGDEYCLYRAENGEPTGDPLGCHPTREKAEAQRKAIAVSTHESAVKLLETISPDNVYLTEVEGRRWRVRLIEAGMSANRRLYEAAVLQEAVGLFDGVPAFCDHPTADEEERRPERSLRDKVGVFENPVWEDGGIEADFIPIDPWLREVMLTSFNEGVPGFVQFSINARGLAESEKDDKGSYQRVTRLLSVHSVDAVTTAAAGGRIIDVLASDKGAREADEMDWETITISDVAANRPDILEAIRTEEKSKAYGEKADLLEAQKQVEALEAEKARLQERVAEMEGQIVTMEAEARMVKAANVVAKQLSESQLPAPARQRLSRLLEVTIEAYAADTSEGADERLETVVKQAIEAEREYLDTLLQQPDIKDMGRTEDNDEGPTIEEAKEKLTEAFVRLGYTEDEAREMAGR